jgi:ribosome modulation factor
MIHIIVHNNEYQEGASSFASGQSIDNNPYDPELIQSADWLEGYNEASNDASHESIENDS